MAPVAKRVKKVTTLPINVIFSHLQVSFENNYFYVLVISYEANVQPHKILLDSKKPGLKSGCMKIHV
jgi:hypothetical protein